MKAVSLGLSLLIVVAGAAWLFRYDYLPPVEHSQVPSLENRSGRSIVACIADRWTRYLSCDTVTIDAKRHVEEMERWLKEQQRK
jgi:hypothetical protein